MHQARNFLSLKILLEFTVELLKIVERTLSNLTIGAMLIQYLLQVTPLLEIVLEGRFGELRSRRRRGSCSLSVKLLLLLTTCDDFSF